MVCNACHPEFNVFVGPPSPEAELPEGRHSIFAVTVPVYGPAQLLSLCLVESYSVSCGGPHSITPSWLSVVQPPGPCVTVREGLLQATLHSCWVVSLSLQIVSPTNISSYKDPRHTG